METQKLLNKDSMAADLAYINSNLAYLAVAITQLEEAGLPLTRSLAILEDTRTRLNSLSGAKGKNLNEKLSQMLHKNSGLEILQKVVKIIEGKDESLPEGMEPSDIAELKYCPITSVDVERSFSIFKNVFSDRWQSFTEENLSKVMICNSYYANKN